MKRSLVVVAVSLALAASASFAARKVKDWHDLHNAHQHLSRVRGQLEVVVGELQRARERNHYDMAGHGVRAEQLANEAKDKAREAEEELRQAEEAARGEK